MDTFLLSLDSPILNDLLFFPRCVPCAHPLWVDCGSAQLCCSYSQNDRNRKTVLHFHGNGETVCDFEDFHVIFGSLGFNSLLVEYRGYGQSTGQPSLRSLITDIDSLLRAIPGAPEGIILHGRSFGSIPALAAAGRDARVCGLILESAIADLASFGPMQALTQALGIEKIEVERWARTHFDHRAYLAGYRGQTLVMHCRHDHLVPFANAEKLYEWASEPKVFKVFEHGDHNTFLLSNFHEYLATMKEFLMRM